MNVEEQDKLALSEPWCPPFPQPSPTQLDKLRLRLLRRMLADLTAAYMAGHPDVVSEDLQLLTKHLWTLESQLALRGKVTKSS